MNKEEKHLVGCKVELIYQKSDIFKVYRRFADNVAIDNEILDNEDVLYITTLDKYNKLQQENKQLKERMLWAKNDLEKNMSIISSRTIRIDELLQRLEYTDNILKGDE